MFAEAGNQAGEEGLRVRGRVIGWSGVVGESCSDWGMVFVGYCPVCLSTPMFVLVLVYL